MVYIGPIFPCEQQLVKADLRCSRHSFCLSLTDPREGLSTPVVNCKLQRPTKDFIYILSLLFKYLSQLIMRAIDNCHQICAPLIQMAPSTDTAPCSGSSAEWNWLAHKLRFVTPCFSAAAAFPNEICSAEYNKLHSQLR